MASNRERKKTTPDFEAQDKFLRRIPPYYYDPTRGKILSATFQNSTGTNRMSVDWLKLTTIDDTLSDYPGFGVASISAELCWNLKQEIERATKEDDSAHCDVVGDKPKSIRKQFRDKAEYLKYPSTT